MRLLTFAFYEVSPTVTFDDILETTLREFQLYHPSLRSPRCA